jgi:wyosine [tRNA(Phe)-imidazoG37] synthetase (radical SAM superfamily)
MGLDFSAHPRNWREYKLVYPVIARRSKGMSIGINLNPDRVCNFDCIYCEVNRKDFHTGKGLIPLPPKNQPRPKVDLLEIRRELLDLLRMAHIGDIWRESEFSETPAHLQRLNDIAFSGDGEPTTFPHFVEAVQTGIEARSEAGFEPWEVKLVLITNATRFHRPNVQEGLKLLATNNGEIWAKLDAGTPEYYRLIDKSNIKYERILDNILQTSREIPLNIQTCMIQVHNKPIPPVEVEAYCDRLLYILSNGGKLRMVQLYTVARKPAQEYVSSLNDQELSSIAARISSRTGLEVETCGGSVYHTKYRRQGYKVETEEL